MKGMYVNYFSWFCLFSGVLVRLGPSGSFLEGDMGC